MTHARRRTLSLGLVLVAAVALALLRGSAFAGESAGAGDSTDATSGDLVEAGRQLYLTSCVSCHGVDGIGTATGPSLRTAGEAAADFMLRTGRMPMAAPAPQPPSKPVVYTDNEIRQLVAYVGSLGDGPAIPRVDVSRGRLQEGSQLFLANCAPCHNSASIGGALSFGRHAPSLQQTPALQVAEAIRIGPGQMPRFGPDVLDDQQVDDIVRYVEYLHDPADPGGLNLGYTGPVAEGFVALLVGLSALILITRWITRDSGSDAPGPAKPADGNVAVEVTSDG
jgi:ubiquinol-cytochrome c reductase cytochrome c subunit